MRMYKVLNEHIVVTLWLLCAFVSHIAPTQLKVYINISLTNGIHITVKLR